MGASNSVPSKKPVVIIIGGGYAGTTIARILDKANQYFVLLIDKKDYFIHNVASLRALVEPSYSEQIAIPYDRLLENGLTIQGFVNKINPQEQTINIHGVDWSLHYDHLVIATGSTAAFPGKTVSKSIADVKNEYNAGHTILTNANKIVIVGGGAVGVELAGEIRTDFPSKSVTLVQRGDYLGTSSFNAKTSKSIETQLRDLGVNILLKEWIDMTPELKDSAHSSGFATGSRQLQTSSGRTIDTDLVIFCTGGQVNSSAYAEALSASVTNDRLKVDQYFSVENFEHIYAIGDCANVESNQAYHAGLQAAHLAKVLTALYLHKQPKPYVPVKGVLMVLSIGRNGGTGQAGTMTFSKWLTAMLKSKTMLVSKTRASLNYKSNSRPREVTESQKANARLSLDTTEVKINELLAGH